jgi:hypothetical protein
MLPSYLKKNSFKIFHFRIKVPHELRDRIGKKELCKSLNTRCKLTAKRKAKAPGGAPFSFELFNGNAELKELLESFHYTAAIPRNQLNRSNGEADCG